MLSSNLDPSNRRVSQNINKYEKLLASNSSKPVNGLKRPSSKYLRTRDTYERLCRTRGSQVGFQTLSLPSPNRRYFKSLHWLKRRTLTLISHVLCKTTRVNNCCDGLRLSAAFMQPTIGSCRIRSEPDRKCEILFAQKPNKPLADANLLVLSVQLCLPPLHNVCTSEGTPSMAAPAAN